ITHVELRILLGRWHRILITPVMMIQVITTYMFFDRHWNKMTTRLAFAVSDEVSIMVASARKNAPEVQLEKLGRFSNRYLDVRVEYMSHGLLPDKHNLGRGPIWETSMAKKLRSELAAQIPEPFVIHTKDESG